MSLVVVTVLLMVGGGILWFGLQKASKSPSREGAASTEAVSEEATSANELVTDTDATPSVTPQPTKTPTTAPLPTPTPTLAPTPTPTTLIETFDSSAALDGFRASNAGGNAGLELRAGRNATLTTRGFVSFGIGEIPDGATIEQATLKIYQVSVVGDPYGAGLRVMLDHLDYGTTLEHADFSAASLSSSFTTLSTNASVGWKEVDVTDQVRSDLSNNRERSQYRLHMATETVGGTVTGDFAYFEAADNSTGSGYTPQLVVRYH